VKSGRYPAMVLLFPWKLYSGTVTMETAAPLQDSTTPAASGNA